MFRNMRRKDREVSSELAYEILRDAEYGVLSTIGDDGYPYGIPLSHVLINNTIYFHAAKTGYKVDNIKRNQKGSYCAVRSTKVLPSEFATDYESVVVFGKVSEVFDKEKEGALLALIDKYSKGFEKEGLDYIAKSGKNTSVFGIEIEHITGKVR